jgi:phosphoribosylaminoimidazole-succinocarboxamide synthase
LGRLTLTKETGASSASGGLRVEGSSKNLYESTNPGLYIQRFKDDQGDSGSRKRPTSPSRATVSNEISAYLFGFLNGFRIPTHFVSRVTDSEMLVRQLDMIPLEVRVCNVASGLCAKRLGMKEGTDLPFPVIEHYYKKPELGKPLLNEFHIFSLALVTPEQLRTINRLASKANIVLRSFFERRGLRLISVGLEFGVSGEQIMIGDEISPRTCCISDLQRAGKPEKSRLSGNGNGELEAFLEIRNRVYGSF